MLFMHQTLDDLVLWAIINLALNKRFDPSLSGEQLLDATKALRFGLVPQCGRQFLGHAHACLMM
jgi:hypothetical protein